MSDASAPPASLKLTTTQWLICVIASIGFAFDIYELLMLPLIVKPALATLGGMSPEGVPLLIPGVGAQGGSLKEISEKAMNKDCGILVNASRAIIYASDGEDFAEKARIIAKEYQEKMKNYLS